MIDDFISANDEYSKAINVFVDALLRFKRSIERIPPDDFVFFEEQAHHQRMIYAVYFAPARSSN